LPTKFDSSFNSENFLDLKIKKHVMLEVNFFLLIYQTRKIKVKACQGQKIIVKNFKGIRKSKAAGKSSTPLQGQRGLVLLP
jgi:hypothetical protein